MFKKDTPYNDLPLLPWNFDYDQKSLLKLALKANSSLAKLNWLSLLIPNVDILISPLLVKESVESNAIENINTTTLKVLQEEALDRNNLKGAEKEVTHYRSSLLSWINKIKKQGWIWYNLLLELQSIIEPNKNWIRKLPWTVIANSMWKVLYTPPIWENIINKLLKNLEYFINNSKDDIDPLIKMPVIHYQFESIHPFYDWNWRTWRILNIVYLMLSKKLDYPVLFLSEYINKTRNTYYKLLNKTTETWNYSEFIEYMLNWVIIQSEKTWNKILKIKNLMEKISNDIEKLNLNYYKITQLLFSKPFISVWEFSNDMWFSRQAWTKYISLLEYNWIISSVKIWRNKLIYIKDFIKLLD